MMKPLMVDLLEETESPFSLPAPLGTLAPLSSTSSTALLPTASVFTDAPGCEYASSTVSSLSAGSTVIGAMVFSPPPGILNEI